jgi:hypothetical protein
MAGQALTTGLLPLERWYSGIRGDLATALSRPSLLRPGMPAGTDADAFLGCDADALTDGAITLVDQGCTFYSLLIVNGPHRGAVVNIDFDFFGPPYFTRDPDFLSWYERWLDELLWGWEGSWFGFGLPGQEPGLAAALLTPSHADRSDALRTLARIPTLPRTRSRPSARAWMTNGHRSGRRPPPCSADTPAPARAS